MDENKNPESRYDVDEEEGAPPYYVRWMQKLMRRRGRDDGIARRRYDT